MAYKIKKLSDLLKGKSNGQKIPTDVDLAIIEGLLELVDVVASGDTSLAAKLNADVGVAQSDFDGAGTSDAGRQVDTVDFKHDGDPV